MQRILPEIKNFGGQLVAISPQLPDQSLEMVRERGLDFIVLSDVDNVVAKEFGIVYTFPAGLREAYDEVGLDIAGANGNDKYELPFPATYVADTNGNVILDFVEEDHTMRLEPDEIIHALEKMTH